MRCADRLCNYLLRGRAQGPTKVIQTRRGQCFRRVSFRPGGGPPLLGRFAAMPPPSVPLCVSPPWRLCAAFSSSWCKISPGFIFLSSCGFPVALYAVSVSLAWAYGVSRGPLWAVPAPAGLAYPPAGSPVWGLLGPSWGWPGSRHGRRRSGRVQRGRADFFRGLP